MADLGGPHGGAYRAPAYGRRGAVASAHPGATLAGIDVLRAGGNAVDAAVAVGAALNVAEPYMSGMGGGGGFMLIYDPRERQIHSLNFLGRVPQGARPELFASQAALRDHIAASSVPGVVGGWLAAHERFGQLQRGRIFEPAIELAQSGYPLTPVAASFYQSQIDRLAAHPTSRAAYLRPDGSAPVAGDVIRQPNLARSLAQVAEGGADVFYRGELGRRLVGWVREHGGVLSEADLAEFRPEWREPLRVPFQGWHVHTAPPPSGGVQYLESLRILDAFDLRGLGHNSAEYAHLVLETIKLASADRTRWIGDRESGFPLDGLLSEGYAAERRALIDRGRAQPSEGERYLAEKHHGEIEPGDPNAWQRENTTHFDAVDADGMICSVTQTNGAFFGNGIVAGDTGITLNNLLWWCDLDPRSPAYMRPGGRRISAMSPAIVLRDERPVLAIGTPGSFGILQTTLQMLLNALVFDLNVQAAIEAPRFRAYERTLVDAESRLPAETRAGLAALGHEVRTVPAWSPVVGGGHGVAILPNGTLSAGADPRRDGVALAI